MLFRDDSVPQLKKLSTLDRKDYVHLGGRVPTAELENIFDLYRMFGEETVSKDPEFFLPYELIRPLRSGDCINLVLRHPDHLQVVTHMLITREEAVSMKLSGTVLSQVPDVRMLCLRTPEVFAPFACDID
jgi:hypothetical protein